VTAAGGIARRPSVGVRWKAVDGLIALRRRGTALGLGRVGSAALIVPALLLAGLLIAGLGILAWRSLHAYDDFYARQGAFSLTQYHQVINDELFRRVLARTVQMALVTTAAALALAVPFAITMARTRRRVLRLALLVVVFLPILTGDITRTYGWLVVLDPHGPISWLTHAAGLGRLQVLGTLWAVGIGTTQVLLPVAVLIVLPAVVLIDPELEDAARTLGARPWKVFARVTLPQLRAALLGAAAICFALAMTEFANPALLGQGVRDYVGNLLYSTYLGIGNPSRGSAIGVLLLIVVTVGVSVIVLAGRLLGRGVRR
jgi:putative spermidine/putrescine transport system permease protein